MPRIKGQVQNAQNADIQKAHTEKYSLVHKFKEMQIIRQSHLATIS